MNKEKAEAIFKLADIEVLNVWELVNQYWKGSDYQGKGSWWLMQTKLGLIRIGWRKRVISLDWEATSIRKVVTENNVTKGNWYVHADSELDAITYLKELCV